MSESVRRIFKFHTEECQVQAFFSLIVCAAAGGMFGRLNKVERKALSTIDFESAKADMGYKFGSKLPSIDWYVR